MSNRHFLLKFVGAGLAILAAALGLLAAATQPAHGNLYATLSPSSDYAPDSALPPEIDLTSLVNADLTTYTAGDDYPRHGGPLAVAGMQFTLATIDSNKHTAVVQANEQQPQTYVIPVSLDHPTAVYALMNSAWGQCGVTIAELDFIGAANTYTYLLTEGDNIRDHYEGSFCNTATDLAGTASFGGGQVRLDMQQIVLPSGFAQDTLQQINLVGYGLYYEGDAFLAAATVMTTTLSVSPATGGSGTHLTFTGSGYVPDEPVTIYSNAVKSKVLATPTTDSNGAFTASASEPGLVYGNHYFLGVGQNGDAGAAMFSVTPKVTLSPKSGGVGSQTKAIGTGFGAAEEVQVSWDNPSQVVATPTTNKNGGWTAVFTIPAGSSPGLHQVTSTGETTGAVATASFKIE